MPLLVVVAMGLTACVSNQYSQPSNLRFQEKDQGNNQVINVKGWKALRWGYCRKAELSSGLLYRQYPGKGSFHINNSTNYKLKPETYNFKVKSCTADSCQSCDVDLSVGKLANHNFVLSVNDAGKPFISNGGELLACR